MAILTARRIAAYPWPALLGLALAMLGLLLMLLSVFFRWCRCFRRAGT